MMLTFSEMHSVLSGLPHLKELAVHGEITQGWPSHPSPIHLPALHALLICAEEDSQEGLISGLLIAILAPSLQFLIEDLVAVVDLQLFLGLSENQTRYSALHQFRIS